MEEHLRNLAASLGECSRIVSQVLESSNSSPSANVSNAVTQVLPANSGRSAGNVSSAVERAGSMLQRSRNTGLCSRLNQRERLQASSPSPSLGSNRGKKPKEPEQSKPFEFALVNDGVSVKPGTPRNTPQHPRNTPKHPRNTPGTARKSPEQPRNIPGTSRNTPEHSIMPRNTLNTARNTLEHQK